MKDREQPRWTATMELLAAILAVVVIVGSVGGWSVVKIAQRAERNSKLVADNTRKLQEQAVDNKELVRVAREVVKESCKRDNQTRATARRIIKRGQRQLARIPDQNLRIFSLSRGQLLRQNHQDLRANRHINCQALANKFNVVSGG